MRAVKSHILTPELCRFPALQGDSETIFISNYIIKLEVQNLVDPQQARERYSDSDMDECHRKLAILSFIFLHNTIYFVDIIDCESFGAN